MWAPTRTLNGRRESFGDDRMVLMNDTRDLNIESESGIESVRKIFAVSFAVPLSDL